MFQGRTIDELIEIVLLAEDRAKQHARKSNTSGVEDNSTRPQAMEDVDHFLLGAA